MEKKILVFAAAVLLGLSVGAISSATLDKDTKSQCERAEDAIKNQSDLSGAIACFEPGVVDVNLTEEVEEGAELECVCRRSNNGNVEFWAINRANP